MNNVRGVVLDFARVRTVFELQDLRKHCWTLPSHSDTEEIPKADLGYVVGDVLIVLQVCVRNVCGPRSD
jgi:hypothetical protein